MSRQEDRRTVTLGRDIKNDIVIDNSSISRNHAIITLVGDEYRLQDNNSLNGVFVNGRKVEFEVITPRDRITIGTEYTLDWSRIEKAFRVKGKAADPGRLSGPSISIGRDPGNDIVIDDPIVSRKHARIYQNEITGGGTRYYIEDLDSRNGVFMNGEKITSCQISPQDRITLGNHCQLNWQEVQSTFRRKFSPPPPPPPPPPPQPLPDPMPAQKKSGNAGLWIALGLVFLILTAGGAFLLFNKFKPKHEKIRTSLQHRYSIKIGEPEEVAKRRAKIEAMMALMDETKKDFPNNNNYITNQAVFDVIIANQSKDDTTNEITTDLYTEMDQGTFSQFQDQLSQSQQIVSRLNDLQANYDEQYDQVLINERSMEDSYNDYQSFSGDATGYTQEMIGEDSNQYYQQCLNEYMESVTSIEETLDEAEEIGQGLTGSVEDVADTASGDPRQVMVDLINGNWENRDQLLGYFETTSENSRADFADFVSDSNTKQDMMGHVYTDFLYSIPEDVGIVVNLTDFTFEMESDTMAKVYFTDDAIARIYQHSLFNVEYDEMLSGFQSFNDLYNSGQQSLQKAMQERKEPIYLLLENGQWKVSIYDESLAE